METIDKAIAVLRANNQDEYKQHESFVSQYETIKKYADNNNIEIEAVFDNAASRADQLKEVLKYCTNNPDIKYMLVNRISSISRDSYKYYELKMLYATIGVKIVSATESFDDTPMGKFMENLSIMAGKMDNDERRKIVKRKMLRRVENGYSVRRPALGYITTNTPGLYQTTNTTRALTYYFKNTLSGKMSVTDLRKAVSSIYHPTALLRKSRFNKLVANPYYAGFVSYGGKQYKGLHEAIITPREQEQLVGLLGQ